MIFPQKNVRFIAINDGVHSAQGENDFAPLRNILASIPCDIHSIWKNPKEPQRSIYADTGGKEEIDYELRFNTIGWNIKNENSECFFDFLVE